LISSAFDFVVSSIPLFKKRKKGMKSHSHVNPQNGHYHFTVIHREVIHKQRILLHTIQHHLTNNLCIK
jgi:hypothetical protein